LDKIDKLISSIKVEVVKEGLKLASKEKVEINLSDYDQLFKLLYRFHSKMERYPEMSIEEKIRDINKHEIIGFKIRNDRLNYPINTFHCFKNLKKVTVVGDNFGIGYSRIVIKKILEMKTVKELKVKNYPLKFLSGIFPKESNIELLDISYNRIEEISQEIGGLKKLSKLILTGNPISESIEGINEIQKLLKNIKIEK